MRHIIGLVPLIVAEDMMPGRVIVRESTAMNAMILVARGRLLVTKGVGEAAETSVRFAGGYVGESALMLPNYVAPWTCMAGDWTQLLSLNGEEFRELAKTYPDLSQGVAWHLRGKGGEDILKKEEQALRENQQQTRERHGLRGSVLGVGSGERNKVGAERKASSLLLSKASGVRRLRFNSMVNKAANV